MHDKKIQRSFKNLFKTSSLASLDKLDPGNHSGNSTNDRISLNSHRSFLKRRGSKSTLTPQSSGSPNTPSSGPPSGPPSAGHSGRSSPTASDNETDSNHHFLGHGRHRSDKHKHLSLKRFFKILRPEHLNESIHHSRHVTGHSTTEMPLTLTAALAQKYNLGRLIGTGASGLVNLLSDKHDPLKVYAVKKFRPRLPNEREHDYKTKVKNEFLIGDYLNHQNLIHTMELTQEGEDFFIVMEYCPYDFFNLVMSGMMSKREAFCYTKQIINGVAHLHEAGIAHRDLKLDNCVVDTNGVLKIIDFGSVFQFRKDKDNHGDQKVLLAKGVVGSDPYLAPEVFDYAPYDGYDARLADIWSIAIIYCCMILRRFPWKIPRTSDSSYRAFAGLNDMDEPVSESEKLPGQDGKSPKYGPLRLLRLLPEASRPLVKGMLEVDPKKRMLIGDVLQDDFYKSIAFCRYVQDPLPEQSVEPESAEKTPETDGPNASVPIVVSPPADLDSASPTAPREPAREPARDAPRAHEHVTKFHPAHNHEHHLVTEKELEHINQERQRAKQVKNQGVA